MPEAENLDSCRIRSTGIFLILKKLQVCNLDLCPEPCTLQRRMAQMPRPPKVCMTQFVKGSCCNASAIVLFAFVFGGLQVLDISRTLVGRMMLGLCILVLPEGTSTGCFNVMILYEL